VGIRTAQRLWAGAIDEAAGREPAPSPFLVGMHPDTRHGGGILGQPDLDMSPDRRVARPSNEVERNAALNPATAAFALNLR
jgi:hypothetical protein